MALRQWAYLYYVFIQVYYVQTNVCISSDGTYGFFVLFIPGKNAGQFVFVMPFTCLLNSISSLHWSEEPTRDFSSQPLNYSVYISVF